MTKTPPTAESIPSPIRETLEWLLKIEDFATARSLTQTVARFAPSKDPVASDYIASVLFRAKSYKEAAAAAKRTLLLLPDSVEAKFNAAKCLNSAGFPAEAESLMRQVVTARPDWGDPQIDLAVYAAAQGRLDEAMNMLLAITPKLKLDDKNRDVVQFNLGWHYLRHGEFNKGMEALGIGRRLKIWGSMTHKHTKPILERGMSVSGKTILICGEGGAGDEMINARFGKIIAARGGRAIYWVQKPLVSLLARTPGLAQVVAYGDETPEAHDYWAPCMDLPRILNLEIDDIDGSPYVFPDPTFVDKWRRRINPGSGRLKIGLRWQGNALYEQDLMRSVPFRLLEQLAKIPGIDCYSLQRDEGSEERPRDSPVFDLGPELRTWDDTAGALANLDLLISSCTSVPHLAAAMGRPTWLFCPLNCYYIWASPGARSLTETPWYQSMRLFRQTRYGDWQDTAAMVYDEVQALVSSQKGAL